MGQESGIIGIIKTGPKERLKMEQKPKYSTTIKSMPLLYIELKKAASLKLQGFNDCEIINKSLRDNIFQVNTESRKKEIAAAIIKRLKILDNYLTIKLVNGSMETSKQVALYALMKTDQLFFEFMLEVYREQILFHNLVIKDSHFSIFFQRKSEQSETVASWGDYTHYKLKQVYKRVLREAGFAKRQKKTMAITRTVMDFELVEHLKKTGDSRYLEAMLGE